MLIRNEVYNRNIVHHPFPNARGIDSILTFIQDRVLCRERCDVELLDMMGLKEYNIYDIFRETRGRDIDDFIWFKFDDDPKDLCREDLRLR